jgi:tetratricopeptide (TPR) repeat protein
MAQLGNGLFFADRYEEALSVREAELAMKRRLGDLEHNILAAQDGIARTYASLGLDEEALHVKRDVYSGFVRIYGEEHGETLRAALNYVSSLNDLKRFEEAKALMRKMVPVARRVFGENHETTLKIRWLYARTLYEDPEATLDDLREAVNTLEDAGRIGRRVLGGAHPTTGGIEDEAPRLLAALRARETQSSP